MKIIDLLNKRKPLVSFEFFPPKTDEGFLLLKNTLEQLKTLSPSFVSMTYGAGGSTREKTVRLVGEIKRDLAIEAMAHLTCVGHSQHELFQILLELKEAGVKNILALRGDPPKGQSQFVPAQNGFSNAVELVSFIKKNFDFCVGVAGYPEKHIESPSFELDYRYLKEKISAGADFIITQLFFDNSAFFNFTQKLENDGFKTPVIAGIMPITDFDQIKRFAQLCGASIPLSMVDRFEKIKQDKANVIELGVQVATEQCSELISHGVRGIHFYTLNKSQSTKEIFVELKKRGLINNV